MTVDVVIPGHSDNPILLASDELSHPVQEARGRVIVSVSASGADIANHEYCIARAGSRHDASYVDEKAPPNLGFKVEAIVSVSDVLKVDI